MNITWKKSLVVAGLALLASAPFIAKADGVSFGVDFGSDNEAHYRFHNNGWHHQEMMKAANALVTAKKRLWYSKGNFGGHRESAMQDINMALDEISAAENYAHTH
jgi:hypothetical protein